MRNNEQAAALVNFLRDLIHRTLALCVVRRPYAPVHPLAHSKREGVSPERRKFQAANGKRLIAQRCIQNGQSRNAVMVAELPKIRAGYALPMRANREYPTMHQNEWCGHANHRDTIRARARSSWGSPMLGGLVQQTRRYR